MINMEVQNDAVTFENVYCVGVNHMAGTISYALCQDINNSKYYGLRVFNMDNIWKTKEMKMLLLKDIDVGALGNFE